MMPPRRILAAVDFSLPSRAALALASTLAGRARAELHVLHALDPALASAAETLGTDLIHRTRADLETVTRSVIPPECRRHLHVVVGDPASAICAIALREQADLVVLGIHGQACWTNAQPGRTARAVVSAATVPTMFVPETWCAPGAGPHTVRLGPVIAAVDGRQPSATAAAAAEALAGLLGTTLELLHVGERGPLMPHRASARVAHGETAVALVDAATPIDGSCPILVMGRSTHGDTAHRPGATVAAVVTAARAPVLMYLPEE